MRPTRKAFLSFIILTGPTGIGKSELGVLLAKRLNAEIISADSMQVYRYFDIGAAKPSEEMRRQIPHHLIDAVDPSEEYNANLFRSDAEALIAHLREKGKTPLVVGGTGLYLKALTQGLECAVKPDPSIREQIMIEMREKGVERMHEELTLVDPDSAQAIKPRDRSRIIRALEVYRATGRPLSHFHRRDREKENPPCPAALFVLNMPRKDLYARIDRRVDDMLAAGLVEEVRGLLEKGYSRDLKPFQGLGYKQVLPYLAGECDHETMVRAIKQETRRYAKRQLTWFRKMEGAVWVDREEGEDQEEVVKRILSHLDAAGQVLFA